MDEKNIQIIRMNSLTNSINLVKELTTTPTSTETFCLASLMSEFIQNGKVPTEKLKKVDTHFKNKNQGITDESSSPNIG
jgi:hypothetical protein